MQNNKQLFFCNEIISLGSIFDGAVFSTKQSQAQFLVKYFIQRPFIENVAALIKSWSFLKGISSPSAEKK